MMNVIGTFRGMKCYACSLPVYRDIYKNDMDVGDRIFIIGGTMVRKNKVIGYYDGSYVKEVYDGESYLKEEAIKKSAYKAGGNAAVDQVNTKVNTMSPKKPEPEVAKEPETAITIKEIRFTDYSKVVDEFFALLEK